MDIFNMNSLRLDSGQYVGISMLFREYYATSSNSLFASNRSQRSWSFNNFITPISSRFHHNSNDGILCRTVKNYSNYFTVTVMWHSHHYNWPILGGGLMTKRALKIRDSEVERTVGHSAQQFRAYLLMQYEFTKHGDIRTAVQDTLWPQSALKAFLMSRLHCESS